MLLLIADKTKYTTKRMMLEAKKQYLAVDLMDTADLVKSKFKINLEKYQVLFVRFFDRKYQKEILQLARKFKLAKNRILGNVLDKNLGKLKSYQVLEKAGLSIPKTSGFGKKNNLSFPLVVKTIHGLGAKEVFFVKNKNQLIKLGKKYGAGNLLVQEFIPADFEYKVVTVGYKSLPFILRFPINKKTLRPEFKKITIFNTTPPDAKAMAGRPSASQPPLVREEGNGLQQRQVVRLAQQSSKLLKRELAKVDILQKDNKFYILEVNRWPGLEFLEKHSKFNVAGEFIRYIKRFDDNYFRRRRTRVRRKSFNP